MTILPRRSRRISLALALCDLLLIGLTGLWMARAFDPAAGNAAAPGIGMASLAAFVPLQLVVLNLFGLHGSTMTLRGVVLLAVAVAVGQAGFLLGTGEIGPAAALHGAYLLVLFGLLWAARCVVLGGARLSSHRRRLAVIAPREAVLELAHQLRVDPLAEYSIVAACIPHAEGASRDPHLDLAGIELADDVDELLGRGKFDVLAFDPQCELDHRELCQLAERAATGTPLYEYDDISKGVAGCFPRSALPTRRLAEAICAGRAPGGSYGVIKRVLDVAIALAVLTVAAIPMACLALIIRLDSSGPALLGQERIGYRGRPFRCLKFRTMAVSTETDGEASAWTAVNDRRITRVGRYLRKARLDELPQLINVLKGEMSLVGPRPVLTSVAETLGRELDIYHVRHAILPGLTGWAQVNQGYAFGTESELAKLQYDLYYLGERSLALDLLILSKTVQTVIAGAGR